MLIFLASLFEPNGTIKRDMAKEKIRMPSSEGGLVRYYQEEYKSKIMLSPKHVLFICVGVAVAAVLLRFI